MLEYSFFKNKRVTVFGLGLNAGGVGTVHFLEKAGVKEITVTDIKSREDLLPSLEKLKGYKNITYVLGQHRPEDFTRTDLVIKNPVVPWTNEYVKLAEKSGVPVEMDSSVFFALCQVPIIGITGTKGKTTTASLIVHLLEKTGRKVVSAGIGQSDVLSRLSLITPGSLVVFELSSWRLSALARLKRSPQIAVVTNIFPDHLNYYRTLEAYIEDKKNIFRYQKKEDVLIANADNETVRRMAEDAPGRASFYSESGKAGANVFLKDEAVMVSKDGNEKKILDLSESPLPGSHSQANILAALATVLALDPDQNGKVLTKALASFPGVPHRLEKVGEKEGILYYNDTAATIPEAASASLAVFSQPIVLIAGGTDKNLDYKKFAQAITEKTKGAVFFRGTATEKILSALSEILPADIVKRTYPVASSMEEALTAARALAESGDVILLSPGATSFGLFQNEFDRGEQFRKAALAPSR